MGRNRERVTARMWTRWWVWVVFVLTAVAFYAFELVVGRMNWALALVPVLVPTAVLAALIASVARRPGGSSGDTPE